MANYTIYVIPYTAELKPGTILEVRNSERDEWADCLEDCLAIEKPNITSARALRDDIQSGAFDLPYLPSDR